MIPGPPTFQELMTRLALTKEAESLGTVIIRSAVPGACEVGIQFLSEGGCQVTDFATGDTIEEAFSAIIKYTKGWKEALSQTPS